MNREKFSSAALGLAVRPIIGLIIFGVYRGKVSYYSSTVDLRELEISASVRLSANVQIR